MARLTEGLMIRIPLEQISRLCDALRGLLLYVSNIGEFSEAEREKLIAAVIAVGMASVVLVGHSSKKERR